MNEQLKRKPNTKCLVCMKDIYRRPSEIQNGRVFCSSICYGVDCRKEIACLVCSKPILAGLNKKTCSRECSNKNRTGIQYRGSRLHDKVITIRQIKMQLLSARGEKCERCSYNKPQVLQVHHKNRNRKENKLTNLELICPNCHYEEHYL